MRQLLTMVTLIVTAASSCGGCDDTSRPGSSENTNSSENTKGDGGDDGRPDTDNFGPGYAGAPGECESDRDCVDAYQGTIWPYADPESLTCATNEELDLGYCTECVTDDDCADDQFCHHGQFCIPADAHISGDCRRDADCKSVSDEEFGQPDWSPGYPVRCRPERDLGPQPPDATHGGRRVMYCRQCEVDRQCGKSGQCFHGECQAGCEVDEDCPGDITEWYCTERGLCYPR